MTAYAAFTGGTIRIPGHAGVAPRSRNLPARPNTQWSGSAPWIDSWTVARCSPSRAAGRSDSSVSPETDGSCGTMLTGASSPTGVPAASRERMQAEWLPGGRPASRARTTRQSPRVVSQRATPFRAQAPSSVLQARGRGRARSATATAIATHATAASRSALHPIFVALRDRRRIGLAAGGERVPHDRLDGLGDHLLAARVRMHPVEVQRPIPARFEQRRQLDHADPLPLGDLAREALVGRMRVDVGVDLVARAFPVFGRGAPDLLVDIERRVDQQDRLAARGAQP